MLSRSSNPDAGEIAMPLIDDVARVCRRLTRHGWKKLFAAHGLDITAKDLAKELGRPLDTIDRSIAGFEDFAFEGNLGITPGRPALSLLFHGLASPRVIEGRGLPVLTDFPTQREIETVENYVFAARRPTLRALRDEANGQPLGIVVFAYEYRPAAATCHRRHADMVFARTGVSRVGTAKAQYQPRFRGYVPHVADNAHAVRVSPAHYGAFIAARVHGNKKDIVPSNYQSRRRSDQGHSDADLEFWVPLHKLFSGPECLKGIADALTVRFHSFHVNEKLRRIHLALSAPRRKGGKPFDTGWMQPDIDRPPFRFSNGIAELSSHDDDPEGLLVPTVHERLVEAASYRGRPVGFNVPRRNGPIASSLCLPAKYNSRKQEIRGAPAYVHARTRMSGGKLENLNRLADVSAVVGKGGYVARHYLDFSGDGWVGVECPELQHSRHSIAGPFPAYSLVTAPDFLYRADQRAASEWTEFQPKNPGERLWYETPTPLSDERLPANLQLPPTSPFAHDDVTVTAIVSMYGPPSAHRTDSREAQRWRHNHMPDDAAGVFAPGWDVARDWLPSTRTQHLANYGLGSPFPEDAKLCAALSEFWPAVAPDATRTFTYAVTGHYATICPLTDEEIGQRGNLSWDGERGPKVVRRGGEQYARFSSFDHADYALNAMAGRMSLRVTSHISEREFQARVAAMTMAYRAMGGRKDRWIVLSFRQITAGSNELVRAQRAARCVLPGTAYRFEVFRSSLPIKQTRDPWHEYIRIVDRTTLYVDPQFPQALIHRDGSWRTKRVKPA